MATDDDELARAFATRHPDALGQAYERFAAVLVSIAQSIVGREPAQDCVHDALLRVWNRPDSYRMERGPLGPFLAACVRNQAMDALRSDARRTARETHAQRLERPLDEQIEIVDPIEAARLRVALAQLPVEQRLVLERAYYDNLSQREIAQNLSVPLGTVKSRISLALRRLTLELVQEGRT